MKTNLKTPPPWETAQDSDQQSESKPFPSRQYSSSASSPGLAAIDAVVWRLQAQQAVGESLLVGVTGCASQAGTSTIATQIALRAGQHQSDRVLLIDASRQPTKSRSKDEDGPGLAEILAGEVSIGECTPSRIAENVFSLSGGQMGPESVVQVHPHALTEMLDECRHQYGTVVVDLPSADNLQSSLTLARQMSGVLLVVESESVSTQQAQRILTRLEQDEVRVWGTLLNRYRDYVPRQLRKWL